MCKLDDPDKISAVKKVIEGYEDHTRFVLTWIEEKWGE